MKLNWKDSFKEENSSRLFEIFSEKNRINIEPQIFAGNILFERNYEPEKLIAAKNELINSIEDSFNRKHSIEPKKIKKENVTREVILRTLVAIIVFAIIYNADPIAFEILSLNIDNKTIALILGVASFLPLLWLKKSNEKAIKKVEKEIKKKNNLINKIETELRF